MPFLLNLYPNSKNKVFCCIEPKTLKGQSKRNDVKITCKDVKETPNLERKISAKLIFSLQL
jgi:hypothetical protein